MNSRNRDAVAKQMVRHLHTGILEFFSSGSGQLSVLCLGLAMVLYLAPTRLWAQSEQQGLSSVAGSHQGDTPNAGAIGQQKSREASAGTVSGTVVDETGAAISGARVKLAREGQAVGSDELSGEDGQFSFSNVAPGPFEVTVTAAGFEPQTTSGVLRTGQFFIVPKIALPVATAVSEVRAIVPSVEVAQEQMKVEEKQRALGVVPNFYVSYLPNAAPLNARQKFELAWKTAVDPVSFGLIAAIAGGEQAQNAYPGYGQGAQGYGKRFGAAYADFVAGTFLGGAILPAILKQDPRYFYKGTGSTKSRLLYSLGSAVVCKGDNGRWQANYSNIIGSFAAGGISNLYYPPSDRHGAQLTFENGLIAIGATGAANLLQEFLIPKLSRNVPKHSAANP